MSNYGANNKITYFFIVFLSIFGLVSVLNCLTLIDGAYFGTYGSDAGYYYLSALESLKGVDCNNFLAPAFVCFQSTVLKVSPTNDHFWFVLFLAVLYTFSTVFMIRGVYNQIGYLNIKNSIFIFSNGIVLWAVVRGVKESLVFFSLAFVYLAFTTKSVFFRIMAGLLFIIVHEGIKPSGSLLAVLVLFSACFFSINSKFLWRVLLTGIVIVAAWLFYTGVGTGIFDALIAHQALSQAEFNGDINSISGMDYMLAPFRFILGPGPFVAFEQLLFSNKFVASTKFGDFLIFIGAIFWWSIIGYVLFNFKENIYKIKELWKCTGQKILIIYAVIYIASYSFSYLGSGDTRHRAVVYFCFFPIVLALLCTKKKSI